MLFARSSAPPTPRSPTHPLHSLLVKSFTQKIGPAVIYIELCYLMFLMMRLQCWVLISARASSRDLVRCSKLAGSVCSSVDLQSSGQRRGSTDQLAYYLLPPSLLLTSLLGVESEQDGGLGLSLQGPAGQLHIKPPLQVLIVREGHGHLRENSSNLLAVLLVEPQQFLVQGLRKSENQDGIQEINLAHLNNSLSHSIGHLNGRNLSNHH